MLLRFDKRFVAIVVWAIAVYSGYAAFTRHEFEAPPTQTVPQSFPMSAGPLATSDPTVLAFVHPQCPCTRATISQLAEIAATHGAHLSLRIYFYAPSGKPTEWVEGATWRMASEIPGATFIHDTDGQMARAFHAAASGTVYAFNPQGDLLYAGGLTASRGHVGQSTGGDALLQIARGDPPSIRSAPAFGCLIFDEGQNQGEPRRSAPTRAAGCRPRPSGSWPLPRAPRAS